jgi:hypothetical protein
LPGLEPGIGRRRGLGRQGHERGADRRRDAQGATLHLCRAKADSGTLVLGEFQTTGDHAWECHAGSAGADHAYSEFDMLVEASKPDVTYKWVPGHATSYPQHSVVAGEVDNDGGRWLVCTAVNLSDNSVHPGYIYDENCVYAFGGRQATAENYLVLASNDPEEATTVEAQPALEGFDPAAILGTQAVAGFCAGNEGICAPALPPLPASN